MTVEARSIIGETIGILRAMGGGEAFRSLDKGIKLLLLDQAGRLEYVLNKDVEDESPQKITKDEFLRNY